jgi:hypothetical protein
VKSIADMGSYVSAGLIGLLFAFFKQIEDLKTKSCMAACRQKLALNAGSVNHLVSIDLQYLYFWQAM